MKPKEIWAFTDVILLAGELEGGGDGWGTATVLTIWLFVTDWQMDRGVDGRGKRKEKFITTQVEKKDIFDEGNVWEEKGKWKSIQTPKQIFPQVKYRGNTGKSNKSNFTFKGK